MYVLDTDVLIDLLRKHPPAVTWIQSVDEPVSVPGYVALELYQGCRNAREVEDVSKLLAPIPLIWPMEEDCQRALQIFPSLHLSHSIGLLDMLIACTVQGRRAVLYTFNKKHFQSVQELIVAEPYSR